MASAAPEYRPIAEHLPAIYQEDAASWEQVRGFLGLVDALYRSYLGALEDLTTWLSPDARTVQPPGIAPQDDPVAEYMAVYAELADWFAYAFPPSWATGDADADLDRRRAFLLRVARLWRRRGTPGGFYAWFGFYFFGLTVPAHDDRPIMIEHFKYRAANDTSGATKPDPNAPIPDPAAHQVTLLVPRTTAFDDYRRRREVVQFVAREAPAHLLFRVCWVPPGYALSLTNTAAVRKVLASLVSYVTYDDGIHLDEPPGTAKAVDRLGEGLLPGAGTTQ
jgi:hypothetical protein